MLRADQADDLRRLLGTVEDWLLHTCFEVRDGCRPLTCCIFGSVNASACTGRSQRAVPRPPLTWPLA